MGTIWTIGHSNHDIGTFLGLLGSQSIAMVADVRRFPGSRRHPQFGAEALGASLASAGIGLRHFAGLGGRRGKAVAGSPNTAWRVESFNAYADHMGTGAFREELATLMALARERRVAIMCSEALPWRCHRRLIADALVLRGWSVRDILGSGRPREHVLTPFARVVDGALIYPAEAAAPGPLTRGEGDGMDEDAPRIGAE
jgi:uncharacterized protein (DUF488 family)